MDRHLEHIYLSELESQCKFAVNASKALQSVLPRLRNAETDWVTRQTLHSEVFRTLHSLMTHSSNASKMLWPSSRDGEAGSARATHLRQVLNVSDAHVLKDRTLRNHLDHFDNRIDVWAEESVRRNYVQDLIAPEGSIQGVDPGDVMRWFDPSAGEMHFRRETFDIHALVGGVQDVLQRIEAYQQRSEGYR